MPEGQEQASSAPNRLREIREARHITLREIATAIGVTAPAIHKAQRRTDALAVSKWMKIAAFLEIPLHELVSLESS